MGGRSLNQFVDSNPCSKVDPAGLTGMSCARWFYNCPAHRYKVTRDSACPDVCAAACTAKGYLGERNTPGSCVTSTVKCTPRTCFVALGTRIGSSTETVLKMKSCDCDANTWTCNCDPAPKDCVPLPQFPVQGKGPTPPTAKCSCVYVCVDATGRPYYTPPSERDWKPAKRNVVTVAF